MNFIVSQGNEIEMKSEKNNTLLLHLAEDNDIFQVRFFLSHFVKNILIYGTYKVNNRLAHVKWLD